MKKVILSVFASVLVGTAFAVLPGIKNGLVSFEMQGDSAVITYTLTGTPAVVTIDLQTNTLADATGEWVSIGGENIGFLRGEANKVVYAVDKPVKAQWLPKKACPGRTFAAGTIRAEVTAWPTNTPPDYMVVNLCEGQNVVRWYASTNALPGGLGNPEYKTTKMVMRKIPAKNVVWMMGSPKKLTDEDNADSNTPAHKVMFSEDYYMGIYEVTQSQYTNLGGKNESLFTNEVEAAHLPAERISYKVLRGTGAGYYWPQNAHAVAPSSPLAKLRIRSGIADMDLPTEAQWEYACRAGSSTQCNEGLAHTSDNLGLYAVKSYNAATVTRTYDPDGRKRGRKPSIVGSKLPNAWGLYDMLGNVYEYCLDQMGISTGLGTSSERNYLPSFHASLAEGWKTGAVTVDPKGPQNNSGRISKRGGSYNDGISESGCAFRNDASYDYDAGLYGKIGYIGFRLCCSVKEAVK